MPSATRPASATEWVASLSPWPEEFGLDGMRQLLAALGDPQRSFPSVHVVGTNGKSTATRTIAALLRAEGLQAGAYTSPHVSGWHERLDCDPEAFERAVARIREPAEELGATQFEALTAAALAEFAEAGVDVAVVEAGLGGAPRRDECRRRAGRPADEHRPRAHGSARRHGRADCEREACSCACGQSSCHVGQHAQRAPPARRASRDRRRQGDRRGVPRPTRRARGRGRPSTVTTGWRRLSCRNTAANSASAML